MAGLDLSKLFGTGGLTMNQAGNGGGGGGGTSWPAGPGQGYYGSQDLFRPSSPGRVLPASTGFGGGGGGGGGVTAPTAPPTTNGGEQQAVNERENQVRGEINSGFDSYFSNLDAQLGGLGAQQAGQNQLVENNYNQGASDLGAQKTSSLADLGTQRRKNQEGQVSSLRDLSENIRNLFQTGSIKLGAMGAGDSSATNQYSYAIGKLGAKERGNVLSQTRGIENDIADREVKVQNIFTQEFAKLKTNRDNQILQVAQWFQDKQSELQNMKAQGQLQKGQSLASLSMSLLQEAQNRLMQADANTRNQQNALQQWALNHATTIAQARQALGQPAEYQAPGINRNQLNGGMTTDATGNVSGQMRYGGGVANDEQFQNPFNRTS